MKSSKAEEILFQEGVITVNDLSFPKHLDKDKSHAMKVSHHEMEIKKDEQQALEGELDLDHMGQQVHYVFKLKNFYDQMNFNIGQRLAIPKAIIELTVSSGGIGIVHIRIRGGRRF